MNIQYDFLSNILLKSWSNLAFPKSLPDAFHFPRDNPHPAQAMLRLVLLSSALLRKGDDEVLQMPKKSWGSFVGLLQEYVEIHRTVLRDVEFPMNNFQLFMFF